MSETTVPAAAPAPEYTPAEAEKAFSTSVVISGIRCLLTYIVLPWLLPAVGVAKGWGPVLGLVVSPIAILFNVLSIRRFHRSGHRHRWSITAVNVAIIGLLVVLVVRDLAEVL
ncbi:MAG TPA: hypothetical protein VD926_03745 [Acidimicrobiales bacterium]|nr:hypothetical protein [Acidimicrobiales bacterium]